MADYRAELLYLYNLFPFHEHPLWRSIREGVLTLEQVLDAETQHCLRTKAGQSLRREALDMAEAISPCIFEQLLETFLEECTHDASGPSHLDLIKRLVMTGGRTEQEIFATPPTPGNAAAMAMYREITRRGAGCHMCWWRRAKGPLWQRQKGPWRHWWMAVILPAGAGLV